MPLVLSHSRQACLWEGVDLSRGYYLPLPEEFCDGVPSPRYTPPASPLPATHLCRLEATTSYLSPVEPLCHLSRGHLLPPLHTAGRRQWEGDGRESASWKGYLPMPEGWENPPWCLWKEACLNTCTCWGGLLGGWRRTLQGLQEASASASQASYSLHSMKSKTNPTQKKNTMRQTEPSEGSRRYSQ